MVGVHTGVVAAVTVPLPLAAALIPPLQAVAAPVVAPSSTSTNSQVPAAAAVKQPATGGVSSRWTAPPSWLAGGGSMHRGPARPQKCEGRYLGQIAT